MCREKLSEIRLFNLKSVIYVKYEQHNFVQIIKPPHKVTVNYYYFLLKKKGEQKV